MRNRTILLCHSILALVMSTPATAEELRNGGGLLLTNGVSTIEGSSGGGLSTWSVISGNETRDGIGASLHITGLETDDYSWRSFGGSVGLFNRVELSYARQSLNLEDVGIPLGLGEDYSLDQDVFGAKVRLFGDVVYDDPLIPQVSIGVQHRRNNDENVVAAVGGASANGTDFYVSATKLFLDQSILVNTTFRLTEANQAGLLGFGGDRNDGYSLQFEGSIGYQVSRNLLIGAEYRTKPDNLGFAEEDDWFDVFVAFAINRNLTATAAYVNMGNIAIEDDQEGFLFSLQTAF